MLSPKGFQVTTLANGRPIVPNGVISALGYNTQDNFLYGIYYIPSARTNQVVKIGSNGLTELFPVDTTLGSITWGAGDFDTLGNLWAMSNDNSIWVQIQIFNGQAQIGSWGSLPSRGGAQMLDWAYGGDSSVGFGFWGLNYNPMNGNLVDGFFDTLYPGTISGRHTYTGIPRQTWPIALANGGQTILAVGSTSLARYKFDILGQSSVGVYSALGRSGAPSSTYLNGARCYNAPVL